MLINKENNLNTCNNALDKTRKQSGFFSNYSGCYRFTPSLYTYIVLQNDISLYLINGGKSQNKFFNQILLDSFRDNSPINIYNLIRKRIENLLELMNPNENTYSEVARSDYFKLLTEEFLPNPSQTIESYRITPTEELENELGMLFSLDIFFSLDGKKLKEKIDSIKAGTDIVNMDELMCYFFCKRNNKQKNNNKKENISQNELAPTSNQFLDKQPKEYSSPTLYIRAVFEKYASLPASERENILYRNKIDTVKSIIEINNSNYKKVRGQLLDVPLTNNKTSHNYHRTFDAKLLKINHKLYLPLWLGANASKEKLFIILYRIPIDSLNDITHKLLIYKTYTTIYENIESMAISSLQDICISTLKIPHNTYEDIIDTVKTTLSRKDIENFNSKILSFTVGLTENGYNTYFKRMHFRPKYIDSRLYNKKEDIFVPSESFKYIMRFNTTLHQIEHYFKTFGSSAFIINHSTNTVTIGFACNLDNPIKPEGNTPLTIEDIRQLNHDDRDSKIISLDTKVIEFITKLCDLTPEKKCDIISRDKLTQENPFHHQKLSFSIENKKPTIKLSYSKLTDYEVELLIKHCEAFKEKNPDIECSIAKTHSKKYPLKHIYEKACNLYNSTE